MLGIQRLIIGRTAVAVLLASATALCAASAATAAPPWLAPVDLAAPQGFTVGTPEVAVMADGTTFAVFAQHDGGNTRIYATKGSLRGGFETPEPLSNSGVDATSPKIEVDRQGNATAVWASGGTVQANYRPAGGGWVGVQQVSTDGSAPSLAVGNNGAAIVAWTDSAVSRIQASVRPAGGSPNFPGPVVVSTAGGSIYGNPSVAMDAAGDAAVLWQRYYEVVPGTSRYVMESSIRPAGGPFATGQARSSTGGDPTAGAGSSTFDISMTAGGRILAMWDYYDGTTFRVEYTERVPGATFATAVSFTSAKPLSTVGISSSSPKVSLNDSGAAAVAFTANSVVQSSVRSTADAAFSAPKALSGTGASSSSAVVSLAANGEAVIAWTVSSGAERAVISARRHPGSDSFGDSVDVTRSTVGATTTSWSTLNADSDDEGNGVLTWSRSFNDGSTTTYTPQAIGYDPVAPALASVTVPGAGTAGTPVSFSATATDRLSSPSVGWDFGDGATATGASVSHTYGAAGAYTVKVIATDGAGNRTEAVRPIQVGAATIPSPPLATGDVDGDGDGVLAKADCNDKDPKIRPGATEIRGNAVDENCDGHADPFPTVGSTASLKVDRLRSGRTRIMALTVARVAKGDVVTLTCAPKSSGCRKAATRKTTIKHGTTVSFTKYVKGMTLSAKATLIVKVTRKNAVSRIITYTMVKEKDPSKRSRCQDPGASRTKSCG